MKQPMNYPFRFDSILYGLIIGLGARIETLNRRTIVFTDSKAQRKAICAFVNASRRLSTINTDCLSIDQDQTISKNLALSDMV